MSQREAAIRSRPDLQGSDPSSSIEGKGRDLSEAIENLPEILNKKMNLEAHTNILHSIMKKIAQREVPTYFELEQNILISGGRVSDRNVVINLLKDGTKGNITDKARLLAILAVSGDSSSNTKAIAEEYDAAFLQGCSSMANPPGKELTDKVSQALSFLRKLQSLQSPNNFSSRSGANGSNSSSNAILSSFLTSAQSRASSLLSKATSYFTKFTPLYFTRVVDNLAEGRSCAEDDSYCYLDPRPRPSDGNNNIEKGVKYSDVIVFVMGGGCYPEFYNLQELLKEKVTSGGMLKNVIYGCTDLVSGDGIMNQLERLGAPNDSSSLSTKSIEVKK